MPTIRLFVMGLMAVFPERTGLGMDLAAPQTPAQPDRMAHVPVLAWDPSNMRPGGVLPASDEGFCKDPSIGILRISPASALEISLPGAGLIRPFAPLRGHDNPDMHVRWERTNKPTLENWS